MNWVIDVTVIVVGWKHLVEGFIKKDIRDVIFAIYGWLQRENIVHVAGLCLGQRRG